MQGSGCTGALFPFVRRDSMIEQNQSVEATPATTQGTLPQNMRPGGEQVLVRPAFWLGDITKPQAMKLEKSGPAVAKMAADMAARSEAWEHTLVTWVTGDPADWPATVSASLPTGFIPVNRLAALTVGIAKCGAREITPEVWTTLTPMAWDGYTLTPQATAARTLVSGYTRGQWSPPRFTDSDRLELGWAWTATFGMRLLADAVMRKLHVPTVIPTFHIRGDFTTLDGVRMAGWGPADTLLVPSTTSADKGIPEEMVGLRLRSRGRDRLIPPRGTSRKEGDGVWVDVPTAPPWGVVDSPVADADGNSMAVVVTDGQDRLSLPSWWM